MKTILTSLAFFSIVCIPADESKAQSALPGEATEDSNSMLWEITGNGLLQSSYLFGTIHIISKDDFVLRHEVDSVFNKCDAVAFEFKLDDFTSIMKIQTWLNLPEGETIRNHATPAQYAKIQKYFTDSLNVDITTLKGKKPFALYQAMLSNYVEDEQQSYDLHFMMNALNTGKQITGLESIEDQLGIFDSITYSEQIAWIITAIDSANAYSNLWKEVLRAYKSEDLSLLSQLMMRNSPELIKYEDLFLTNRNKAWMPVIEQLIKKSSAFIAVGAGHLPGENGILSLLHEKGYIVKPL
jgi:uncharacterized protein YbaP (TraB family)